MKDGSSGRLRQQSVIYDARIPQSDTFTNILARLCLFVLPIGTLDVVREALMHGGNLRRRYAFSTLTALPSTRSSTTITCPRPLLHCTTGSVLLFAQEKCTAFSCGGKVRSLRDHPGHIRYGDFHNIFSTQATSSLMQPRNLHNSKTKLHDPRLVDDNIN